MIAMQSSCAAETEKIAYKIGKAAKQSQIYCLCGDLGAGKTAFVRGFAKGAGVFDDVTSPTFGIINEYYGATNIYHFDVYRISSVTEMEDTGYEEYFYGDGICLIEWADIIKELIPDDAVWITIEKDINKGEDYREIRIEDMNR